MYSDAQRFPHSGGYVWIAENNVNRLVSVFKGSIFVASSHEPVIVLKLMYHWACQTNVAVSLSASILLYYLDRTWLRFVQVQGLMGTVDTF